MKSIEIIPDGGGFCRIFADLGQVETVLYHRTPAVLFDLEA